MGHQRPLVAPAHGERVRKRVQATVLSALVDPLESDHVSVA